MPAQSMTYRPLHGYLVGIDSLNGDVKGFAFDKEAPGGYPGYSEVQITAEFLKIENSTDLAKALDLDVSAPRSGAMGDVPRGQPVGASRGRLWMYRARAGIEWSMQFGAPTCREKAVALHRVGTRT